MPRPHLDPPRRPDGARSTHRSRLSARAGSGWSVPPTAQPLLSPALASGAAAPASPQDPLWAALDTVSDPVSISTAVRDGEGRITDFRIEYVNAAAAAWAGLDREAVIGCLETDVQPSLKASGLFDLLAGVVESREPYIGKAVDYADILRDGNAVSGAFDIHAVAYGAGYICVWRDVSEREETMAAVRQGSEDLALVSRVNGVLAGAVSKLAAGASLEAAAQAICDELCSLPAVDFAVVGAFVPGNGALILAVNAVDGIPLHAGFHLPAHRSDALRTQAEIGPWADYWTSQPEDGEWGEAMDRAGLNALAFGPIVHGSHVDGGVVIGTRDPAFARTLVEKWASLIDFSTTPSALLAERLHARRTGIELRGTIAELLSSGAHRPVFQPIVELATGEVVGHEALTRFESGQRPDHVFADAWTAGLGAELERATLSSAIEAARRLPAGLWLDLNISPRLLEDPLTLRTILHAADRPIVLEITEHEVIDDYAVFLKAVRSLGHDIRLAVDDAGAGVANFGHIIDLGPDFVKLDISLVRRVNAHLGRQALVVGMRYFSRTSGCRLVAEGIETGVEARTLAQLGVEFGQGYWFGRPEPAP